MFSLPSAEYGMHGKYRILAELGQGGTANVYLAVARGPRGFNKLVVLKFLKPELAGESEFRLMFLNEARLAARLNHPNVVQTNEVFEENGRPIIVMEYLEGASLSRVLMRARELGQPMSIPMHLRIICEALGGLHYSHELRDYDGTPLGVVHRDMTPQNLFVSFSGKVSVLDFGIAKVAGSIAETRTGVLKGKLRYMAPEQIMGELMDRRADIFAVGVMIWEAAAGERMWKGASDATIMNKILNGNVPSPRTVRGDVPERLEQICMKALAADANDRYATAAALQADLEEWLAGDVIANRTIGQFVQSAFEEARAKTRSLIDRQLASVEAKGDEDLDEDMVPNLTQAAYMATSRNSSRSAARGRPRRGWILWAAVVSVALAGFLMARSVRRPAPLAQAAPGADVSRSKGNTNVVGSGDGVSPSGRRIALKLSAAPPGAKLYLDDQPLPDNPFFENVSPDGTEHSVRAEARGYVTERKVVAFDSDVEVAFRLGPAKAGPRSQVAAHHIAPSADPTPTAQLNCDPPYVIDEMGIRRLRSECLAQQ
jgi:serine/threonine protein kinase